jgi:hypothetical protein
LVDPDFSAVIEHGLPGKRQSKAQPVLLAGAHEGLE